MRLLSGANCTKANWRKRYVVNSFGILVPIVMLSSLAIFTLQSFAATGEHLNATVLLALLTIVATMSFVGFIDDMLGSRLIGGLRGHFSQLRFGIMTTGTLKAIIGAAVSLIVAGFVSRDILTFLTDAAVMVLAINAANLFDLRPGRAIKVFTAGAAAVFIASWSADFWGLWGLIIPPVAGLFWGDMKEQSMMGDAGSNVLGAILGFTFVINLSQTANLAILVFLVLLHAIAEKYSLSDFIERTPIIKQLDELGLKR